MTPASEAPAQSCCARWAPSLAHIARWREHGVDQWRRERGAGRAWAACPGRAGRACVDHLAVAGRRGAQESGHPPGGESRRSGGRLRHSPQAPGISALTWAQRAGCCWCRTPPAHGDARLGGSLRGARCAGGRPYSLRTKPAWERGRPACSLLLGALWPATPVVSARSSRAAAAAAPLAVSPVRKEEARVARCALGDPTGHPTAAGPKRTAESDIPQREALCGRRGQGPAPWHLSTSVPR